MAAVKEHPDLEKARRIVLEAVKDLPAKVYLFGSWARGEQRRYSDIDVAIRADGPVPADLFVELQERLEHSDILYPVDLVDLHMAPRSLRERVLEEGVLWNE